VWHGSSRVEEPGEVTLETWLSTDPPGTVMRAPISWGPSLCLELGAVMSLPTLLPQPCPTSKVSGPRN